MSNRARFAIFFLSWLLMSGLSAQAQLRPEAAAHHSQAPTSDAGCPAADAITAPCSMRILLQGFPFRQQYVTGLGTISAQGLSAITDLSLPFGTTEISHDGQFVAYNDCRPSEWATYVVDLGTSEKRKVMPIDRGHSCPDVHWSRDDRMLSYVSAADYGLNVVSVDGSRHVRLPTAGFLVGWHAWSPSGTEIVYEYGRGGSRVLRIIGFRGNVRDLTHLEDINDCETWLPDWSPDGTLISFTACRRLYTISPQGAGMKELASAAYSPKWSVDGQWIFFLSGDRLMRVRRDGKLLSKVAEIPPPYWSASPFSLGRAR